MTKRFIYYENQYNIVELFGDENSVEIIGKEKELMNFATQIKRVLQEKNIMKNKK